MRLLLSIFWGVMLISSISCAQNESAKSSIEQSLKNIAHGVDYTMYPMPRYSHCSDPGDKKQLTDGLYTVGHFWTNKTTVGWHRTKLIIVTIDLGEDKAIKGVSFNTAAGVAGVKWPSHIVILVAGEDKIFYEVGELTELSANNGLPDTSCYSTHRYWTDKLLSHGRYVAFVFDASPYAFLDELEVYEGDPSWVHDSPSGKKVGDLKKAMSARAAKESIYQQIKTDIGKVRGKIRQSETNNILKQELTEEINNLEKVANDSKTSFVFSDKVVMPLNNIHEKIFRVQARLWKEIWHEPILIWQSGLWDFLDIHDEPQVEKDSKIEVHLMRNEYRAAAFNISNTSQNLITLPFRINGLPGGNNPEYITVHQVEWTATKENIPVAAALPPARLDKGLFFVDIPPGMTRQVWLTFHPKTLLSGEYTGGIELLFGDVIRTIPVTMHIYPFDFPDQPTLHFGGWDYTNGGGQYSVTQNNITELIDYLRSHYVDSPWATRGVMPFGKYNSKGDLVISPNTREFDEWIGRWVNAEQYMIFLSVTDKIGSFPIGSNGFGKAVQSWARFWVGHLRKRGLKPEQFALLLVDEPYSKRHEETVVHWAKNIKAACGALRIWENPVYKDKHKALDEVASVSDVLCVNRGAWTPEKDSYKNYFLEYKRRGGSLEFYACRGPVRSLDPYSYHRLQAWLCWLFNARASYFWAFSDAGGGTSWNEYTAPSSDYAPQFLAPESVTTGKHMEAAREGIEDYEYMVMLQKAILRASNISGKEEAVQEAKRLLVEIPKHVLSKSRNSSLLWKEKIDRSVADKARVRLLETLMALSDRGKHN